MNEFDFCEYSPTKKHSESWFCNFACEHCGQEEDNGKGEPGPSDRIDYLTDSLITALNAKNEELAALINDLVTANTLIESLRAENAVLKYQANSFRQQLVKNAAEDAKDATILSKEEKQRVREDRIREYVDSQDHFVFTDEVIAAFPEYKEKHVRRAMATLKCL